MSVHVTIVLYSLKYFITCMILEETEKTIIGGARPIEFLHVD